MSVQVNVEDLTTTKGSVDHALMVQFFENAKNEFESENSKSPKFINIKQWKRPEITFNLDNWQPDYLLVNNKIKLLIDVPILIAINKNFQAGFAGDKERIYLHYKSPDERTSDMSRNTDFLVKVSTFSQIYVTALFLILHHKNILSPISQADRSKDKNLDIGYCELMNNEGDIKLYVVWLENVRDKDADFHEFHLHCQPASRYYKPEREFLV